MSDPRDDDRFPAPRLLRSSRGAFVRVSFVAVVFALFVGCSGGDTTAVPTEWSIVAMQVATVVWVFTIGASIGSFLNVVVYRLPLGLSLSSPPSRCPACETSIERRDNLPVFGWLLLRGRCRACGVAISPRYPIVEMAVGLLFVALLSVELASGGANLPVREPDQVRGLVNTLWSPRWDLIGLTLYHLFLLCSLLAAGLMAYDGRSIRRLLPMVVLVGLALPLVWPWLRPVPAIVPRPEWMGRVWGLAGLLDGAAGTIAGLLLGGLLSLALPPWERTRRLNVIGMILVTGVFLGWQAAVGVAWFVCLCVPARNVPRVQVDEAPVRSRYLGGLAVACVVLVQVVNWRPLSSTRFWRIHEPVMALAFVAGTAMFVLLLRAYAPNREAATLDEPRIESREGTNAERESS